MDHLNLIAQAIDRGNYAQADQLLNVFLLENPQDPWGFFYLARLDELAHLLRQAEDHYRQVLKTTTNKKLINLARQGIQRVQTQEKNEWNQALATATQDPSQTQIGCLILEPLDNATKTTVAPEFARLMHLDAYTARLHLPSRIWRLYRTGAIGELNVYQAQLKRIGIPAFCVTVNAIEGVKVLQVETLRPESKGAIVTGRNDSDQLGNLRFNWSEVGYWVEGLLPIFEQVVDQGAWNKMIRKEKIQDYAHIVDLHLPQRRCLLRLCDRTYQFYPSGIPSRQQKQDRPQTTSRQNWNQFLATLTQSLPHLEKRSSFNLFGEAALDQDLFLARITPHLDLFRSEKNAWDSAFHLYSVLHFIAGAQ